ncbi:MAG: hypothetical protein AAFQ57_01945 [Cyanobacteria bacterium J06626_14]
MLKANLAIATAVNRHIALHMSVKHGRVERGALYTTAFHLTQSHTAIHVLLLS